MNKPTILLLEDNAAIMKANDGLLTMSGYRVLTCSTLQEARSALEKETPDLLILDVMLPDGSGIDFCREYRATRGAGTPVLFLTVLREKSDMVQGYGVGGTDYLTKPFDLDILLMKVEALLEQTKAAKSVGDNVFIDPLRLDFSTRRAYMAGRDLLLTPKEFTLLGILIKNRYRCFTQEELYERVWGMDAVHDVRTVKEHMSRLRRKLGINSSICIATVRGKGYHIIEK